MSLNPFSVFRAFSPFSNGGGIVAGTLQPIALISPTTGAVFTTADGKVLTRGTKRMKPQES